MCFSKIFWIYFERMETTLCEHFIKSMQAERRIIWGKHFNSNIRIIRFPSSFLLFCSWWRGKYLKFLESVTYHFKHKFFLPISMQSSIVDLCTANKSRMCYPNSTNHIEQPAVLKTVSHNRMIKEQKQHLSSNQYFPVPHCSVIGTRRCNSRPAHLSCSRSPFFALHGKPELLLCHLYQEKYK